MYTKRAAGPDIIPVRRVLCVYLLADNVNTGIFNISLSQATRSTCFKAATIVPGPNSSNTFSFLSFDFSIVTIILGIFKVFDMELMELQTILHNMIFC